MRNGQAVCWDRDAAGVHAVWYGEKRAEGGGGGSEVLWRPAGREDCGAGERDLWGCGGEV